MAAPLRIHRTNQQIRDLLEPLREALLAQMNETTNLHERTVIDRICGELTVKRIELHDLMREAEELLEASGT